MAGNQLLNVSLVTNEALMVLENSTVFTKCVDRNYSNQFAVSGAKAGDTINVRRPGRFIGTSGPALNVEDFNETSVPVTLLPQFHVDTQFTTRELLLNIDEFSRRIIKPAVATIANKIDYDGLLLAKNSTANIVGTAGTPPTALLTYLTGAAILDSEGAPRDGERTVVVSPFTGASIVDSLKGLFMPSQKVSAQYEKGLMGTDSAGMDWRMDQNVANQTFGSYAGTMTVDTTSASFGISSGWAQTSTIQITASAALTLNQGDTIQIAGVLPVNPQNRNVYSNTPRNFVVTANVNVGTSPTSVTVSPAIITAGQFQNVSIVSTSATAAVTPFNKTGVTSPQNILLHKNAFTVAMADVELVDGVVFCGRASDPETGLSIRVLRQYTINNDSIPMRCDVIYGWAPLYPELACRIAA